MNNEIREILDYMKKESNYKHFSFKVSKLLLDYIDNLQQENEELKKNQRYYKNGAFRLEYDKETLSDMIDDYKSRIEKAVKYIKKHILKYDIDGSIGDFDEFDILIRPSDLLDMLQNGGDKDE